MKNFIDKIRFHQAWFDKELTVFEVFGSDAVSFLHGQSTQNIKNLPINHWLWASFLDVNGRIESYFLCLKSEKKIFLILPQYFESIIQARFEKFVITEDVGFKNLNSQKIFFYFGEFSNNPDEYIGTGLEERVALSLVDKNASLDDKLNPGEVSLWWKMQGLPPLDLDGYQPVLLNQTRFFELALDMKKGCYPGQETVSKIAINRGASYYPVLLKIVSGELANPVGALFSEDKKIGEISGHFIFEGNFYLEVMLLRDYRINNSQIWCSFGNQVLEAIVQYFPLFSPFEKNKALEFYDQAIKTYHLGRVQDALDYLERAIKFDQNNPDFYETYGVILGQQKKYEEAIEWMDKLLKIDQSSVMAHTNKSLFFMKMGQIEAAEKSKADATLATFMRLGREAQEKAENEKSQGKTKRKEMFLQVLEIDPDDVMALKGLADLSIEDNHDDEALGYLQRAYTQDENNPQIILALVKIYQKKNQIEEIHSLASKGKQVAAQKGQLAIANELQQILSHLN